MPKPCFGRLIGPKAVLLTAVLLAFMVGTSYAAHRPNPLMDYAPQETGIYDTYYDNLIEDDCRYCHGASLADRHHYNEKALTHQCTYCHIVGPAPDYGVTVYRDCRYNGGDVACHFDFTNGWHHNTYLADSNQCTACHNPQILGDLTPFKDPTLYPPTVVTPSPYSCENCHWEQLVDTYAGHQHPSTDIHYDPWGHKVANMTDATQFASQAGELAMATGNNGWNYSTLANGTPRPAGWEKDILDNMGTHHMNMQGTVSTKCANCHANDPGSPSWDPNDPILIRYCERCHDIASLHRIPGHVSSTESWDGFMMGNNNKAWQAAEITTGALDAKVYRSFSVNERCIGCHGDGLASYVPPYDCANPPHIASISANAGEPGAVITLTGSGFGEDMMSDPTAGADSVTLVGAGTGGIPVKVPVAAWTDTEVSFLLPAWVFPEGSYTVQVNALGFTVADCTNLTLQPSNVIGFTVTHHPNLTDIADNADPSGFDGNKYAYGPWYSTVSLSSTGGFSAILAGGMSGVIGSGASATHYFSQVILTTSEGSQPGGGPAGSYVIDTSAGSENAFSWTDTALSFKLIRVWQDLNGNYIQDTNEAASIAPDFVHVGDYDVRVRTVYWVDKNSDGKPEFNMADPTDPASELNQVCVSDPVRLNLTNNPFIWKIKPPRVTKGTTMSILGANFGDAQHDSVITVYKADGTTVVATYATGNAKIRLWSNTKLRLNTKGLTKGKHFVKVTVGGIDTVKAQFRII